MRGGSRKQGCRAEPTGTDLTPNLAAGPRGAGRRCSVCPLVPTVRYDLNNPAKHAKLDFLNNLATGLVFIIVVVNIFITAFGVQKPVMDVAPRQ